MKKAAVSSVSRTSDPGSAQYKILFLSDERLIAGAHTDMTYKFFLDLDPDPEAHMIDPSLLTKFRKTRIT